ncbi:MAG TPA: hypothetical protein PK402_03475 [Tepidisphaeraceae bacterium]|nr:hypothetical protein [Tepidisphaeraceae bacterium]
MLITTAVIALVFTAIAFATDASFRAYAVNQGSADSLQRARMAILRISSDLRSGSDVTPYSDDSADEFSIGNTVEDSGVRLTDQAGRSVFYYFDSDASCLLAEIAGSDPVVLARGVTQFEMVLIPARSEDARRAGAPWDLLNSATIQLTIQPIDDLSTAAKHSSPLTLTGSVAPRGNSWQ